MPKTLMQSVVSQLQNAPRGLGAPGISWEDNLKRWAEEDEREAPFRKAEREKYLSDLARDSRRLFEFIEQWFEIGSPSNEGLWNSSAILYNLKDARAVRDEFVDAVDRAFQSNGSKSPLPGSEIKEKYVLHIRAAEVRGALEGIEQGWKALKFAEKLSANKTRKAIAKYVYLQLKESEQQAKLSDIDICKHLDTIQKRNWTRVASRKSRKISPDKREEYRLPMPAGWRKFIDSNDDMGPWTQALEHPKLSNNVRKFLSVERAYAKSSAAKRYWAWSELINGIEHVIEAAQAATTPDRPKPTGAYLEGVIVRHVATTGTLPEDV
jgi:hypothetical protein